MFCGNASVGEKELTDAIITHLKRHLENLSAIVPNSDDNKKEKHTEYVSLLESRYIEIEKKEFSLWDKYSEENMPKQVFDIQVCGIFNTIDASFVPFIIGCSDNILYVSASMKPFRYIVGGAQTILDALMEIVGYDGTIPYKFFWQ